MGHFASGDWFLVDLSRAVANLAEGAFLVAGSGDPGYGSFPSGAVFAQVSSLQTDADVGRGEADQRRQFLVEPDRTRLSLLVATVTNGFWVVGR